MIKPNTFCRKDGIDCQFTAVSSHQSNGIAERLNRTLFGRIRAMLFTAKLPLKFWALASTTAAYLKNRFPNSAKENRSPHELWFNQPPDLSHLKTWGCVVYVHNPKQLDKLRERAKKMIMVGYGKSSSLYKVFDPSNNGISYVHNLKFDEKQAGGDWLFRNETLIDFVCPLWITPSRSPNYEDHSAHSLLEAPTPNQQSVLPSSDSAPHFQPEITVSQDHPNVSLQFPSEKDSSTNLRRSTRINKGNKYKEVIRKVFHAKDALYVNEEPPSFAKAINCSHWKQAMDDEYQSVMSKDVFDLVDRPT